MPVSKSWRSLEKHLLLERFQPSTSAACRGLPADRTAAHLLLSSPGLSPAPCLPRSSLGTRCAAHSLLRQRHVLTLCSREELIWARHRAVQSAGLPWCRATRKFCQTMFQGFSLIFVSARLKSQAISVTLLGKVFQKTLTTYIILLL